MMKTSQEGMYGTLDSAASIFPLLDLDSDLPSHDQMQYTKKKKIKQ